VEGLINKIIEKKDQCWILVVETTWIIISWISTLKFHIGVLEGKHELKGSIPLPLMSKGEMLQTREV
jgi:hypothetical protein